MFRGQQIRVLLLNDMERLERTLFRLEQGRSSSQKLCIANANILIDQLSSSVVLSLLYSFIDFFVSFKIFNAVVDAYIIRSLVFVLLYYCLQLKTLEPKELWIDLCFTRGA